MTEFDTELFLFFHSIAGQSPFLDGVIVFFADYLAYALVAIFVLGLLFWRVPSRRKMEALAVAFLSTVISRVVIVEAVRFFYHHPRPFVAMPEIRPLFIESSYSFPSGHASFFFALSAVIYCYNKKAGVVFLVLSFIMGLARITAGVHYPLDIIGGALLGLLVGYGVCRLVGRFNRN